MKEKRNYITPDVAIEAWLGKECWMAAGISGAVDPNFSSRRRQERRVPAF